MDVEEMNDLAGAHTKLKFLMNNTNGRFGPGVGI